MKYYFYIICNKLSGFIQFGIVTFFLAKIIGIFNIWIFILSYIFFTLTAFVPIIQILFLILTLCSFIYFIYISPLISLLLLAIYLYPIYCKMHCSTSIIGYELDKEHTLYYNAAANDYLIAANKTSDDDQ